MPVLSEVLSRSRNTAMSKKRKLARPGALTWLLKTGQCAALWRIKPLGEYRLWGLAARIQAAEAGAGEDASSPFSWLKLVPI
jgi:hypothetical protein